MSRQAGQARESIPRPPHPTTPHLAQLLRGAHTWGWLRRSVWCHLAGSTDDYGRSAGIMQPFRLVSNNDTVGEFTRVMSPRISRISPTCKSHPALTLAHRMTGSDRRGLRVPIAIFSRPRSPCYGRDTSVREGFCKSWRCACAGDQSVSSAPIGVTDRSAQDRSRAKPDEVVQTPVARLSGRAASRQ
jgi:hypothetical protein